MKLNETQTRIIQLAANAELRTPEQMLSILLAEGISFYFMDRDHMRGAAQLDASEAEDLLVKDAIDQLLRRS